MTINETDWRGHVVWYVQYFWHEVEWVEHDTKIDEKIEYMTRIVLSRRFQFQFFRNCAQNW